ncbi:hypothetical protein [Isoptericola haloaureus]|uniref:Uncharacterized protein n=1 Tax=Isoptericola haloaureus TaxID=1542902 RepID=A0ABU7Z859_9MICO
MQGLARVGARRVGGGLSLMKSDRGVAENGGIDAVPQASVQSESHCVCFALERALRHCLQEGLFCACNGAFCYQASDYWRHDLTRSEKMGRIRRSLETRFRESSQN